MRKGTAVFWLVVVIAAFALLAGCDNPEKVGVTQANVQAEFLILKNVAEKERGGYEFISMENLKTKLDHNENILVIDTMPYDDSYKKQHIPTAVNFVFPKLEMETIDPDMKRQYLELLGPDKDRKIVVYCGFVKCGRSHNGAMWATKLGYANVYRCLGGIFGWMEAGYPVEAAK